MAQAPGTAVTSHTVNLHGNTAQPDQMPVNHNDKVRWNSDLPTDWTVQFDHGTPFINNQTTFDAGNPEGTISPDCERRGYKYSVTVNGQTNDPAIIVK